MLLTHRCGGRQPIAKKLLEGCDRGIMRCERDRFNGVSMGGKLRVQTLASTNYQLNGVLAVR